MLFPPFDPDVRRPHPTVADGPVRHAYLHVPYCIAKCRYCAFVSEAVGTGPIAYEAYVTALLAQIRAEAPATICRPLETVYFGGGTPTCLPTEVLGRILESIRTHYGLTPTAEITLEMNPGTLGRQALRDLRHAGFNRLSIGIQALDDTLLKRLGRTHTAAEALETLAAARAAGFTDLSADVMLGLEGQTLTDVRATLELLLTQNVPHLSFYSLIVEEGTPLARGVAAGRVTLPDEDTERAMYRLAFDRLRAAGLVPYEIANSARPGRESRHNLAYWAGHSYYGWGPAASGYVRRMRYSMTPDTGAYLAAFTSDDPARYRAVYHAEDVIDGDEQLREYVIFGLRRLAGISDSEARALFGRPLPDAVVRALRPFVAEGLLYQPAPDGFAYTADGLDLADRVARTFVDLPL